MRNKLLILGVVATFILISSISVNAGPIRWLVKGAKKITTTTTKITANTTQTVRSGKAAFTATGLLMGATSLLAYYQLTQLDDFPVEGEITKAKLAGNTTYSLRICLDAQGNKVAVPASFSVCPFDGRPPQSGTTLDLTKMEV